jgi:hypothetical protein
MAMTPASILYLFGMLLVLTGERVVGGDDPARYGLTGLGLALLLASFAYNVRERANATNDENRDAHAKALLWSGVGALSIAVYALSLQPVTDALSITDAETLHRYKVVVTALVPILALAGTLPFVAVDHAISREPILVTRGRIKEATLGALATAFALAWIFPLNFLGTELNKRWDLGYFKTAEVGTRTQALVEGLDQPIEAYLFFPGSSDVTPEIRGYFDQLAGGNLTVNYVDHALEPELSKELKVRDNGNIALVKRLEGPDAENAEPQVERIKIGEDFDSAKRKLKTLDEEVQKSLTKLVKGKRVAYFTVGHGEMFWKGSGDDYTQLDKINAVKKILESLNYSVKELGLAEGLGTQVPEDAELVAIMGPKLEFQPEELLALDAYRQRGGHMLVCLEPGGAKLEPLLTSMGVAFDPSKTLLDDKQYLKINNGLSDRANLVTNKFSSHDSVTNVSRAGQTAVFAAIGAGAIQDTKAPDTKVTVTVRTLPDVWPDANADYENQSTEARKSTELAAAVTQGTGDTEFRAVVVGDANWASDMVLTQKMFANLQFLVDGLGWLNQDATLTGTTSNEEDVKIQHTRENQAWWFYATAVFVPIGFMSLGAVRVRARRKGGAR